MGFAVMFCTIIRLLVVSPLIWAMGDHHPRPFERLGKVLGSVVDLHGGLYSSSDIDLSTNLCTPGARPSVRERCGDGGFHA